MPPVRKRASVWSTVLFDRIAPLNPDLCTAVHVSTVPSSGLHSTAGNSTCCHTYSGHGHMLSTRWRFTALKIFVVITTLNRATLTKAEYIDWQPVQHAVLVTDLVCWYCLRVFTNITICFGAIQYVSMGNEVLLVSIFVYASCAPTLQEEA